MLLTNPALHRPSILHILSAPAPPQRKIFVTERIKTSMTKPVGLVPKSMMKNKPPHGAPCTRCGVCCYLTQCPLSIHVFGAKPGPCRALEKDADGRFSCGLITTARALNYVQLSDAASLLISAGDGCDTRINGEPTNTQFYAKLARLDRLRREEIRAARKLWGVP